MNGSISKGKKVVTGNQGLGPRWTTTPLLWALHAQHNECISIGIHVLFGIYCLEICKRQKAVYKICTQNHCPCS